VTLTIFRI